MLLKENMKRKFLHSERKSCTLRFREVGESLLRSGARQHGAGSGAGKRMAEIIKIVNLIRKVNVYVVILSLIFKLSRAGEAMFIFKREKLKEKKESVVTQPSKRQKVADPASSGKLIGYMQ
jgi:hypothetical protein